MPDSFKERLRHVREDLLKLSQQELASRSGLPPTSISHFESGSRKPSFDNLRRLAEATGYSTDYLMGLVDKPEASVAATRIARHLSNASQADLKQVEDFAQYLAKKKT